MMGTTGLLSLDYIVICSKTQWEGYSLIKFGSVLLNLSWIHSSSQPPSPLSWFRNSSFSISITASTLLTGLPAAGLSSPSFTQQAEWSFKKNVHTNPVILYLKGFSGRILSDHSGSHPLVYNTLVCCISCKADTSIHSLTNIYWASTRCQLLL